jgi:hypothetical protein
MTAAPACSAVSLRVKKKSHTGAPTANTKRPTIARRRAGHTRARIGYFLGDFRSLTVYRLFKIAVPSGVPSPVHGFQPVPALYPLTVFVMAFVPEVTSWTTPLAAFE